MSRSATACDLCLCFECAFDISGLLSDRLETVELDGYLDNPGQWMAHCHSLDHAELGMMSELMVDETTH